MRVKQNQQDKTAIKSWAPCWQLGINAFLSWAWLSLFRAPAKQSSAFTRSWAGFGLYGPHLQVVDTHIGASFPKKPSSHFGRQISCQSFKGLNTWGVHSVINCSENKAFTAWAWAGSRSKSSALISGSQVELDKTSWSRGKIHTNTKEDVYPTLSPRSIHYNLFTSALASPVLNVPCNGTFSSSLGRLFHYPNRHTWSGIILLDETGKSKYLHTALTYSQLLFGQCRS